MKRSFDEPGMPLNHVNAFIQKTRRDAAVSTTQIAETLKASTRRMHHMTTPEERLAAIAAVMQQTLETIDRECHWAREQITHLTEETPPNDHHEEAIITADFRER